MLRVIFLSLFIAITAGAQVVTPLFKVDGFKTYVTIPFRLQQSNGTAIPIYNMQIVQGQSDCQSMVDPNISSNFLLKCANPASVTFHVYYQNGDALEKIIYGPFSVTAISSGGVVQPPPPKEDYSEGQNLYAAKCLKCHQNPYEKERKTYTQIKTSLTTVGQMNEIILTDAQIKAISAYLFNLD